MHQTERATRRGRAISSRVLADVIFVNVSMFAAVTIRYLIRVSDETTAVNIHALKQAFFAFYYTAAPLLTLLTVLVFFAFGIYTRTRFYARKHKAVILLQAITVAYLLFLFGMYATSQNLTLIPRGAFVISYVLTTVLSGGTRIAKHLAVRRYDIVDRKIPDRDGIRRVLVVGGAGFIGSVVVRQLLESGYSVRVLDAVIFGNSALSDIQNHPQFELIEGDLRHVESVVRAVKGSDAVIHLGAVVGDPACALDEQSTRDINTIATKLLTQVCRGFGVKRLLFASTCAVYGASDQLVNEQSALNPISAYARSKADAESVVLNASSRDFCPTVFRLGTAFGHSYRPRFDLVVNLLTAKAWTEKKITIYNKDQWRPFVHVWDIAHAFVLALSAREDVVRGQIFNLGSSKLNLTLGQVAEEISLQFPDTEIEYVETDDRRNYRVSFDKIQTFLSLECQYTVRDGVREIKNYLERELTKSCSHEIFDNSKMMKASPNVWLSKGRDSELTNLVATQNR